MFKVFRIKEEHSAFLSDGVGLNPEGERVSDCIMLLFPRSLPLSAFLFPFVLPFFCCPPLHVYCISLRPPVDSLSRCHSLYSSSLLIISLPLPMPHPHPSISTLSVIILPDISLIHFPISLLHSPSTCASVTPPSFSFPTETHKADGGSNQLKQFSNVT